MFQSVFSNYSTIDRTGSKLLGRRNLNGYIRYGNGRFSSDQFVSLKEKKSKKLAGDVAYGLKALAVVAAIAGGAYLIYKKGGIKDVYKKIKEKVTKKNAFGNFIVDTKAQLGKIKNKIFKKGAANAAQNTAQNAAQGAVNPAVDTTKKANIFTRFKNFINSKFTKNVSATAQAATQAAPAAQTVAQTAAPATAQAAAQTTAQAAACADPKAKAAETLENAANMQKPASEAAQK